MENNINLTSNWNNVNWKDIYKSVFILQQKIFYFSKSDDIEKVHRYQILLINSFKSKLLAVKQITQNDRKEKVIESDVIRSLSPTQCWKLAQNLKFDVSTVCVQKKELSLCFSNTSTVIEKIKQKLVLFAVEPQWEAKFDTNLYGFRPGRCSQDAVEAIYESIDQKPKYVLTAEIEKDFSKICHKVLLKKLNVHPELMRQINEWLKVGIINSDPFYKSENLIKKIPEDKLFTSLLANIALNGIEQRLKDLIVEKYGAKTCKSFAIIRYAGKIVLIHPELKVIEFCKTEFIIFLAEFNLKLNQMETSIQHTLKRDNNTCTRGFKFLGFHIYQLPIGKYKRKNCNKLHKTLIVPSKESVSKHVKNLKVILRKNVKSEAIIDQLNSKITSWSKYFRLRASSEIFYYLDHRLLKMLLSRLGKIHSTRSSAWIYKRYFKRIDGHKWTFHCWSDNKSKTKILIRHVKVKSPRHVKVKENYSIYDSNLGYWSVRLKKIPTISNTILKLLKK